MDLSTDVTFKAVGQKKKGKKKGTRTSVAFFTLKKKPHRSWKMSTVGQAAASAPPPTRSLTDKCQPFNQAAAGLGAV